MKRRAPAPASLYDCESTEMGKPSEMAVEIVSRLMISMRIPGATFGAPNFARAGLARRQFVEIRAHFA